MPIDFSKYTAAPGTTAPAPGAAQNTAPSIDFSKYQIKPAVTAAAPAPKKTVGQVLGGAWKKVADVENNFATGVAKGEVAAVQGAGQAVLKTTDALGITKNQGNSTFLKDPGALKADGAAQKTGKFVGEALPYVTGAGEAEGAAIGAKVAAKTGSRAAGYVAGRVAPALANVAIGTAQNGGDVMKGAENAAVVEIASPAIKGIAAKVLPSAEKSAVKAAGKAEGDLGKIQQAISPKLTAKETKLALSQGRIAPGRDPGILHGGTPDEVLPSASTEKASQTIARNIPGAANMKQPELYQAVGQKIEQTSNELRPQMQKVPINEKTVQNITDKWETLKSQQLNDPYMDATANVEKLQSQFENDFLKKSKSGNLGDLWDTRIAYDKSVPANVKEANALSPEKLQSQKAIWLQNRGILNDAINDTSEGLGGASKKAFSDMTDMYNAQRGIESSYSVPKEGPASRVKDFIDTHPKTKIAGEIAAGAVGLHELKKVPGIGKFIP